jgi:serine/threonine protein kinase
MFGIGWAEIVLLVCCAGVFVVIPLFVVGFVLLNQRSREANNQRAAGSTEPFRAQRGRPVAGRTPQYAAGSDDADARQTIIARLTQRFCPGCRTALAADAPEGLCPACLMAGGLASEAGHDPIAAGMAVTTPPSGSRPPATGEWANLAPHFPELEVLELLGQGGMGAVYKARQKNLDRMVALKVIPPDAAKDPAFTERFNREARALARMNHPNIVTVYDFGQRGEVYYLLMEYVDGVNLRHTLRAGNLQPREALAIVPQICDALQYAHDQGVVHRDIKPENVLLDRSGRVKIADFGLAKLLGSGPNDFTLTRTQQIMGTPRYMAPEQIEKPTTVDHRADIYSLGVVLYEMLTGELPIGRFDAPSHKVEIDVRIDQVVMRALEKSPDKRYQRASEVKSELVSATSWQAGPSRPPVAAAAALPVAASALTSRPVWNTPAPATKSDSSTSNSTTASTLPPGEVLGIAIGMVTGILMMVAGLALGIYGILNFSGSTNSLWAWVGSGFGCLVGGFGATAGSYNSYRQLNGAQDLMRSPEVTWLDWVMRGFFLFGLLLLTLGLTLFVVQPPNLGWRTAYFCLLLGGISSLQAGSFLIWRALTRPPADLESLPAAAGPSRLSTQPVYLQAVVLPVALLVGIWLLVLIDVVYARPPRGAADSQARQLQLAAFQLWHEGVVIGGVLTLVAAIVAFLVWRLWGPRETDSTGCAWVPSPFGGRGWAVVVAALAAVALLTPWFRLEVVPVRVAVVTFRDAVQVNGAPIDKQITIPQDGLQEIAAMPSGWRMAHRGIESEVTAGVSLLLLAGAILTIVAASLGRPTRGLLLLGFGGAALLLIQMQMRQTVEHRQDIAIDRVTTEGLLEFAHREQGAWQLGSRPLIDAVQNCYRAVPSVGLLVATTATSLSLIFGASELCWGAPRADGAPQEKSAPRAPFDPAREAIRRRVAGPALGLMLVGALGLLPALLLLLAVPAVTLHEAERISGVQVQPHGCAAGGPAVLPIAMSRAIVGYQALTLQGLPLAPLLLAAEAPAESFTVAAPLFIILVGVAAILGGIFSLVMIVAGYQMQRLRYYGLAVIASVLAMLPVSLPWIIGLPIGIWSLAVLLDPKVREAFES